MTSFSSSIVGATIPVATSRSAVICAVEKEWRELTFSSLLNDATRPPLSFLVSRIYPSSFIITSNGPTVTLLPRSFLELRAKRLPPDHRLPRSPSLRTSPQEPPTPSLRSRRPSDDRLTLRTPPTSPTDTSISFLQPRRRSSRM